MQEPWSAPIVDALKEKFGGEIVNSYSFLSQNQIVVKNTRLTEIMMFLRDNSLSPFDYLADETAVHWPKDEEFELVYNLYSFAKNEYLRFKTRLKEFEEVESVVGVWLTANWLEREVYDMFASLPAESPRELRHRREGAGARSAQRHAAHRLRRQRTIHGMKPDG